MSEWITTTVGKLGKVVTGKTPSKNNPEDWGNEYLFITPSDYGNYNKSANHSIRGFSEEGYKRHKVRMIPKHSCLVTCIGSDMGKVVMNAEDAFCNQQINALIPNTSIIDSDYAYYFFKDSALILKTLGSDGTAVPILNKSDFEKIELSIPPLSEQKAIASVLSSLDNKIDLLHRQNKTLEAMAETLFRQWFIEEAKEEWEEIALGEIVNITSSKRIFYSEYVDVGIPFYRSKEIIELNQSGKTQSDLFITVERFNEINKKFGAPKEGDILLTSVGTLGVTYQVKKGDVFYFKDGNLTWFKDFKRLSSNIILCWLNSKIGKEQLDNISIGSTQAALTIQGLKSLSLRLPPDNVAQTLDDRLSSLYGKVTSNHKQIQTLEKLRDTLLPKLMSGEVRVQYQTEEVA